MKNLDTLKKKIIFTLLVIVVYRLGSHIPLPTVDMAKLGEMAKIAKSGIFSMFNTFSGGAISRASIFALGIAPYITSSIIMQLLVASYPTLKRIKKEGGEQGAAKITQYTRYLTVFIAFFQGFSIATGLVAIDVIPSSGDVFSAKLLTAFVITVSTLIVMWMGDQITSHGIGNGSSVIIFAGIVSEAPRDLANVFTSIKTGSLTPMDGLGLFIMFGLTCLLVSFCERSFRMIYIQYPRQNYHQFMAKQQQAQQNQFIPLKINTAGVIPPIFASALLLLPTTIISMFADSTNEIAQMIVRNFNHGKPAFVIADVILILFFSYFYNTSLFETDDLVNGLRRNGAFIPGVRPGDQTSEYLKKTLKYLSFIGGGYLVVICGIPELMSSKYGYSFLLGGTGLLIVFSVINDVVVQFQTHMMSSKYEKAMKKYNQR
ncbi:preprotein translocase subunit SecY [Candidatus Deianiraea vastatrix]|nr:preprotein translocase subunit SecY [Candidatus Deianiraea vastatrix]